MYVQDLPLYIKYSSLIGSKDYKIYEKLHYKYQKSIINMGTGEFIFETKLGKFLTHLVSISVFIINFIPNLELDKLVFSIKSVILLVFLSPFIGFIYYMYYLLVCIVISLLFFFNRFIIERIIKTTKDYKEYLHLKELLDPKFSQLKSDIVLYINSNSKLIIDKLKTLEFTSKEYLEYKYEFEMNYNFIKQVPSFIGVSTWSFLRESGQLIQDNFDFSKNEKGEIYDSTLENSTKGYNSHKSTFKITNKFSKHPKEPKLKIKQDSDSSDDKIQTYIIDEEVSTNRNIEKFKKQKISKTNFNDLNKIRHDIGVIGEEFVLSLEIEKLKRCNLENLITKVEHISKERGDGYGFDIMSFDEDGKEIYIEVKSTTGKYDTDIFFSINEIQMMKQIDSQYLLYKVYNLDIERKTGDFKIFRGYDEITNSFDFYSETLKGKFNRSLIN